MNLKGFSQSEQSIIIEFKNHIGNIDWEVLEEFIIKNKHILRPIAGHCFETWFDKLILALGYEIRSIGGDDIVDRIINGKTLQLKTPYKKGTIPGERIAYALHKTHGLEKRPENLYKPDKFADFFVGKHPTGGVIICPRDKIPRNNDYPNRQWHEYLADPVHFKWNNEWINRFDLLGMKLSHSLPELTLPKKNELFPKLGEITNLSDIEIIKTILNPENFRVLEQNLKGSIRQLYFATKAKELGIHLKEPNDEHSTRTRIKVDFIDTQGRRIQVKGRTKSLCSKNTIGVEVKGSHGRIPQRLYKKLDFDFLAVVLDPKSLSKEVLGSNYNQYNFVIFPVSSLPMHENSRKKMYIYERRFKDGFIQISYSSEPSPRYSEEKTKEWNEDYLKDVFYFDVTKCRLNDFSLLL